MAWTDLVPGQLSPDRVAAKIHYSLGDQYQVEYSTGSGRQSTLWQVAAEVSGLLTYIFLQNAEGKRPVFGGTNRFQDDPHWRNHVLFCEYFHRDNGAGIGASHRTGWTGLVAKLIQQSGE
ncbi:MAG TPA: hypothetical protein VGQ08_06445 [Nitrospiraceae bacterium]|nr:hypothetical protein [Nitrospiraceae bacterium]